MSRFVPLSVAGLLIGTAASLFAQGAVAQGEQIFASCQHRFAVIYPGQPKTRRPLSPKSIGGYASGHSACQRRGDLLTLPGHRCSPRCRWTPDAPEASPGEG